MHIWSERELEACGAGCWTSKIMDECSVMQPVGEACRCSLRAQRHIQLRRGLPGRFPGESRSVSSFMLEPGPSSFCIYCNS